MIIFIFMSYKADKKDGRFKFWTFLWILWNTWNTFKLGSKNGFRHFDCHTFLICFLGGRWYDLVCRRLVNQVLQGLETQKDRNKFFWIKKKAVLTKPKVHL